MSEPRSWLFVPADSEKKVAKALESEADAVIFDLEDSVAPDRKSAAREIIKELPKRSNGPQWWVRLPCSSAAWVLTSSPSWKTCTKAWVERTSTRWPISFHGTE